MPHDAILVFIVFAILIPGLFVAIMLIIMNKL